MHREITLTGRQFMALIFFLLSACYLLLWAFLGQNIPAFVATSVPQTSKDTHEKEVYKNRTKPWPVPGNSAKHLHVYVQLSDLHLSAIWDKTRISDLSEFCHQTLHIIKPEVVIVTGDLTDAKLENFEGSHQSLWEWQQYRRVIHQSGVLNHTVWLDIRGNHDAFDVPSLNSPENFYRSHSIRGQEGQLSYHYQHRTDDGDVISFVAMDACLDPGPKRPFNFFGMLAEEEIAKVQRYAREAVASSSTTIFYGHYTTSVISFPSSAFARNLINSGIVYLCGHLHTFANLLPAMYAFQPEGFLELELGDWKDNRLYRLLVLDHGLLSFIDTPTHHYPVVLVTNPKSEKFLVPDKEPIDNIRLSTHIRVLAFSNEPITHVDIYIDGDFQGRANHVEGMLYTLPWQPEKYATGYHYIRAVAEDLEERQTSTEHMFVLSPSSRSSFSLFQSFVLLTDHTVMFKYIFGFLFLLSILPLIFFKLFKVHILMMTDTRVGCFLLRFTQKWIRRFCCLGNTPQIFYPIFFYDIYLLVGPWFVGYILSEHLGVCFAWGLWVRGKLLLTSLTYLYAALHILTFNLPLTLYLAKQIDRNISKTDSSSVVEGCLKGTRGGWLARTRARRHLQRWLVRPGRHFSQHFLFFFVVIFQAYLVLSGFLKAYGLLAFLLCPIRTWAILLALLLHYRVTRPPHAPPHAPTTTHLLSRMEQEDQVHLEGVPADDEGGMIMRSDDDDEYEEEEEEEDEDDNGEVGGDVLKRHHVGSALARAE